MFNIFSINFFFTYLINDNFKTREIQSNQFLKLFEQKYNTNQAKYTHIAYNILMHFASDFSLFNFKNLKDGGKINSYAPLHHYVDYEFIPVE